MNRLLKFFKLDPRTKDWISACCGYYDAEWKSCMPMFKVSDNVPGRVTLGLSFRIASDFADLPEADTESVAFQAALACMGRVRGLKEFTVKQLGEEGDGFREVLLVFQV